MNILIRSEYTFLKYVFGLVLLFTSVVGFSAQNDNFQPTASFNSSIPGGSFTGDGYGFSVDLKDDFLFVGSPFAQPVVVPTNVVSGAIYIYKRTEGVWSTTPTQIITTKGASDHIGANQIEAVDKWLFFSAVGTPIGPLSPVDTVAEQDFTGSLQIYKLNEDSGQYEFYQAIDKSTPGLENLTVADPITLGPPNPSLIFFEQGASLGLYFSVDPQDNGLLIGAQYQMNIGPGGTPLENSGAVYSFVFDPKTKFWVYDQTLTNPDGPQDTDAFGSHVAAFNGVALISNSPIFQFPKFGPFAANSSVYVYNKVGGKWISTQKLQGTQNGPLPTFRLNPPDFPYVPIGDAFGAGLAIDKEHVLIGAPLESNNPVYATLSGAVYVYDLQNGKAGKKTLVFKQKITSSDPYSVMTGFHVALDKKTAIVGDPGRTGPSNFYQGGIIVLNQENPSKLFVESQVLYRDNGGYFDFFGTGIAIDKSTIVGGGGPILGAVAPQLNILAGAGPNRPPLVPVIPLPAVPVVLFESQ